MKNKFSHCITKAFFRTSPAKYQDNVWKTTRRFFKTSYKNLLYFPDV